MEFTYSWYKNLIAKIQKKGYDTVFYHNWKKSRRCVILRHDIDNDVDKAVRLASIEKNMGVCSTYFVLVSSDFYNIFSKKNYEGIKKIIAMGHEAGLHFDEVQYPYIIDDTEKICQKILWEAQILEDLIGQPVKTVSMHRPSKNILESDIRIPGIINSYGQEYLRTFKYISDSRRYWREPVEEIIDSGQYDKIHILTHAFWYNDSEFSINRSVREFVNRANLDRYYAYADNFSNLQEVMKKEDVLIEGYI